MGKSRYRRDVSGILLLDKPQGPTSNQALKRIRWLYEARRAGHTGSLDPMATGLLPICLGQATKVAPYLLDANKTYLARCQLGVRTDTADADGRVVAEQPVPRLSTEDMEATLGKFRGPILQVPPMYSALHHEGKRLYQLARAGEEVVRQPRQITLHRLELAEMGSDWFSFEATCSKGTYIRTLAEDIAAALGTCGHLTALRRTAVSGFTEARLTRLAAIEAIAQTEGLSGLDALLIGADQALAHLPKIHLDERETRAIMHGQALVDQMVKPDHVVGRHCCYAADGAFLGIVRRETDGVIRPERLFVAPG